MVSNVALTVVGILVLATVVEAVVEYFLSPILKPPGYEPPESGPDWRSLSMRYISAVVAIPLCFAYSADILALIGLSSGWWWVGQLLTGFLISRGANWIHEFASRWLAPLDLP